jgi:long-chain acyl-CoA synthetase
MMLKVEHSPLLKAIFSYASEIPNKTSLIVGDKFVSYQMLAERIEGTVAYLQAKGLKNSDTLLLAAAKDVEFVYIYFAAHAIGVINVVVDPATKVDKLEYIISKVNPKYAFGLKPTQVGNLKNIAFNELKYDADVVDVPTMDSMDIADVMFTTGTTGNPKGVCLSHYNIASSANNINGFIKNTSKDIEVLGLPLSHSFGLGRVRCTLLKGATIVLLGSFANLKLFFEALEKFRATGFGMVPAVWQYIKTLSGTKIGEFANQIKYIEIGSAPMPIEDKLLLMKLFPNTRICMHYGLTEASRSFFMEFHDCKDNLNTIGMPASSEVGAKVLDDNGNELVDGKEGEICVKGNMVMSRYLLDEENKHAFWGDYFRTGDFGYKDNDGRYYLIGRKKELINIGGKKVSPVTIEDAIKTLGIDDCACIAMKDPKGILGEVVKVFIVKGKSELTFDDIKLKLVGLLEPYQIPVEYEWISSIPKTSSGKIQRQLLK